jgi:hypothetical protein
VAAVRQRCWTRGRSGDLSPKDRRWRFNFLDYLYRREGGDTGFGTEAAVNTFMNLIENKQDGGKRQTQEQFWVDNARALLRYALLAITAAGADDVTIGRIKDVIYGLPYADPGTGAMCWPQGSYLEACIEQARLRARYEGVDTGIDEIERFFRAEFGTLGTDRQAAGVKSTLLGMLDPFLSNPAISELLCAPQPNCAPGEFSRRGAIVVLDLPYALYDEAGRTAALTLKYIWQRTVTRRQGLPPGERPVTLWCDEAQTFVTRFDNLFTQSSRSSVASTVYLTQNLNNFYAAMEAQRGKFQTDSLIGTLATKIWHRNADHVSNQLAADTIGRALVSMYSGGSSHQKGKSESCGGSDSWNYTSSSQSGSRSRGGSSNINRGRSVSESVNEGWRESYEYAVPPRTFTLLRGGGPECSYEVQAVVFKAGRLWHASGQPYIGVTFDQRATLPTRLSRAERRRRRLKRHAQASAGRP